MRLFHSIVFVRPEMSVTANAVLGWPIESHNQAQNGSTSLGDGDSFDSVCSTASIVFQSTKSVPTQFNDALNLYDYSLTDAKALTHCASQEEQQRLENLDEILRSLFQGGSVLPPSALTRARDHNGNGSQPAVLDCGSGKGAWIEHLLDEFGGDLDVSHI